MTIEQLKEMLEQEQEDLQEYVAQVNLQIAVRRGRISMLEQLVSKEDQDSQPERKGDNASL